jgi:hypothetical protein
MKPESCDVESFKLDLADYALATGVLRPPRSILAQFQSVLSMQ